MTERAKRQRSQRAIARDFKKAGGTKEEYIAIRMKKIAEACAKFDWRPSEKAMGLADMQRVADDVWGA